MASQECRLTDFLDGVGELLLSLNAFSEEGDPADLDSALELSPFLSELLGLIKKDLTSKDN